MMKAQTVFNRVVKHLLTQKKRAMDKHKNCAYLTEDGLKCAVGCLIPKKLYDEDMEGETVESLYCRFPDVANKIGNMHLLSQLQDIHDNITLPPSRWPQKLRALAKKEGLKYNDSTSRAS